MFRIFTRGLIATGLTLLTPALALAHTGAPADAAATGATDFAAGFLHPLTGIDHLLAIVAVGVIAGRRGGGNLWHLPLLFAGFLAVGALAGAASPVWVPLEIAVAITSGALWLWAFAFARGPWLTTATVLGVFALVQGVPHGWELSGGTAGHAALTGAFVATVTVAGSVAFLVTLIRDTRRPRTQS